jgi:hypothetical protein
MSPPLLDGAGERTPLVAEELGLEKRLGQRRAIHRDERTFRPGARQVNRPGDHLLAGTALAAQKDRGARGSDACHLAENLLHPLALADDVLDPVGLADLLLELLLLPLELLLQPVDRRMHLQRLADEASDYRKCPGVRLQCLGAGSADPFAGQHPEDFVPDLDGDGDIGERARRPLSVGPRFVQEGRLLPHVGDGGRAAGLHRLPDDTFPPHVAGAAAFFRSVAGGQLHPDLARGGVGQENRRPVETEQALEGAKRGSHRPREVLRGRKDLPYLVNSGDLLLFRGSAVGHGLIISRGEGRNENSKGSRRPEV